MLWETGIPIGALRSLDLEDVHEDHVTLRHRPGHGTTLNGFVGSDRSRSHPDSELVCIEELPTELDSNQPGTFQDLLG